VNIGLSIGSSVPNPLFNP